MKKILLLTLLLAGCAVLNQPNKKPVDVLTPSVEEVESSQPEVTLPPVVVLPEIDLKNIKITLKAPQSYSKHIPRVVKFFELALIDNSVINKDKFDFSDATPESIRESIRKGFDVTISTYKPSIWKGGKWSKVIGYHSAGKIYLNSNKLNRKDCEIINTLVHEPFHNMGYSHGDNYAAGKDNSVPYWMGDRAEQLCLEGKI